MDKGYQESGNVNVNVERNVGDNQYNEGGNVGVNKRLKDVQMETVIQTEQCEELRSHVSNLPKGEVREGSFESLPMMAQPELYPGCKMSPSSFLSRLFHLKDTNQWSDGSVDMLLEVLRDAVPEGGKLPGSHIEAKILMRDLGRDEHHDHKDHKPRTEATDDDARELHGHTGAKSSHASATSRGKKKERRKSRRN